MSSRKKKDNESCCTGCCLFFVLAGIAYFIALAVSVVYELRAVILFTILSILAIQFFMFLKRCFADPLETEEETEETETTLPESPKEQIKMRDIESNAKVRNAELKLQDKKDNYKQYLELRK